MPKKHRSLIFSSKHGKVKEKEMLPTSAISNSKSSENKMKDHATVSAVIQLEKHYHDRINTLQAALEQKDGMIQELKLEMEELNQHDNQNDLKALYAEFNPAEILDSDNDCLVLLAKQCEALRHTVSSLESTLMLKVKELDGIYEYLDTMKSDLRVAEVAKTEAETQFVVNQREVTRLQNVVNNEFGDEIKRKIAENGQLEQGNKHLQKHIELLQMKYEDSRCRVNHLENTLLIQERELVVFREAEQSAENQLREIESRLEEATLDLRNRHSEIRKLKKDIDKRKRGCSLYDLCTGVRPGQVLEVVSVDLPDMTDQMARGLHIREGPHGVYIDKVDTCSAAGRTNTLHQGDRIVEINQNDVSNASFEFVKKDVDSDGPIVLVVARVVPDSDVRNESKFKSEALRDQLKGLVSEIDKTTRYYQKLQVYAANLKDNIASLKANQTSSMNSASDQTSRDEIQNLKALLAQKEQYLKTLETTVRSKNELLVTMEMDSLLTPRSIRCGTAISSSLTQYYQDDVRRQFGNIPKDDSTAQNLDLSDTHYNYRSKSADITDSQSDLDGAERDSDKNKDKNKEATDSRRPTRNERLVAKKMNSNRIRVATSTPSVNQHNPTVNQHNPTVNQHNPAAVRRSSSAREADVRRAEEDLTNTRSAANLSASSSESRSKDITLEEKQGQERSSDTTKSNSLSDPPDKPQGNRFRLLGTKVMF